MKEETYTRIKADFPLIFTSTVIALMAQTLYMENINLLSSEGIATITNVIMFSLVASGIMYGILKVLVKWRKSNE